MGLVQDPWKQVYLQPNAEASHITEFPITLNNNVEIGFDISFFIHDELHHEKTGKAVHTRVRIRNHIKTS